MHWTEMVGFLLVVFLAILGVLLLGLFLLIGGGLIVGWLGWKWNARTIETPVGRLTKAGAIWEGFLQREGEIVTVSVDDADGSPHPDSLDRLACVISELPELEGLARSHINDLTDAFHLDSIDIIPANESGELVLVFLAEDVIEFIEVSFKASAIVDWTRDTVH